MGCKLKSYNTNIEDLHLKNKSNKFKFQYGHRVEPETHNWMVFRNYINMSFSYMTFVIKDNFDVNSHVQEDFLFDIEGYDFILNRNTLFTEGNLVKQDYEQLKFILENYQKIDPVFLESLHYQGQVEVTKVIQFTEDGEDFEKVEVKVQTMMPLHISLKAANTRMVNLLLVYMTKIKYTAVKQIRNILKELITYKAFTGYM